MLKITKCFTDWCLPCKTLSKTMSDILPTYDKNVSYTEVNIEDNDEIANKYGIRSIPTMIFEQNGEVVCKLVGLHSAREIKEIIDRHIK